MKMLVAEEEKKVLKETLGLKKVPAVKIFTFQLKLNKQLIIHMKFKEVSVTIRERKLMF